MLLANALNRSAAATSILAGSDDDGNSSSSRLSRILGLFNSDKRADGAPFSIQNVAEIGLKDYGIYPGQWYGINSASQIFATLND